jgi:uncharacterized membrane protein
MANKFDTNPLDPDFPKRVAESQQTVTLPNLKAKTQLFAQNEEATRRFDNQKYASLFETPNYQPPNLYQPATERLPEIERPTSRKVDKVGLPENVLMVLPYAPWGIGLIAGLLELLFVPSNETKVRFHAAQGLALHIGIFLIGMLLSFGGNFYGLVEFSSVIFQIATFIFLIVSGVKVWKGKAVHVEQVDDLTNWLEEKVIIKKGNFDNRA